LKALLSIRKDSEYGPMCIFESKIKSSLTYLHTHTHAHARARARARVV